MFEIRPQHEHHSVANLIYVITICKVCAESSQPLTQQIGWGVSAYDTIH